MKCAQDGSKKTYTLNVNSSFVFKAWRVLQDVSDAVWVC